MKEISTSSFVINTTQSNAISNNQLINTKKKNSIEEIKEQLKRTKTLEPLGEYESQVVPLEKELFENLNLEWGVDIISEDIPLTENKKCYCH